MSELSNAEKDPFRKAIADRKHEEEPLTPEQKAACDAYWSATNHDQEHAAVQRMIALGLNSNNYEPCPEPECVALREAERAAIGYVPGHPFYRRENELVATADNGKLVRKLDEQGEPYYEARFIFESTASGFNKAALQIRGDQIAAVTRDVSRGG
jgi:hypothetical protein